VPSPRVRGHESVLLVAVVSPACTAQDGISRALLTDAGARSARGGGPGPVAVPPSRRGGGVQGRAARDERSELALDAAEHRGALTVEGRDGQRLVGLEYEPPREKLRTVAASARRGLFSGTHAARRSVPGGLGGQRGARLVLYFPASFHECPPVAGCRRPSSATDWAKTQLRQAPSLSVRESEPVLPEPLQKCRILRSLVLDHPSLVLSQPHPDPRCEELQRQRQRLFRRPRRHRPSHSPLRRAEIESVKTGLARRQAPSIAHFCPGLVLGDDGLCPLGVPNEAMAHRGPDRRMVPAFIARTTRLPGFVERRHSKEPVHVASAERFEL
jgi:hypothetical protein